MATAARGRKSTRGRSASISTKAEKLLDKSGLDLRVLNGRGYKQMMKTLTKSPWVLYLAGGVGSFMAVRFLMSYYKNHPEVGEFIKENFDTIEEKIRDYRGQASEESMDTTH